MESFSAKVFRRLLAPPLRGLALALFFASLFYPCMCASSLIASLAQAVSSASSSLPRLPSTLSSSTVTASSHRRLGPEECTTYVYTSPAAPPTEMRDRGSCPTGGGSRAFLLDTSPEVSGGPSLLEVSPVPDQQFVCRPGRPCSAIIVGFGLQAEDTIAVLEGMVDCPPRTLGESNVIRSERHITSSTAVTFHYLVRPQVNKTELPIFNLNILQSSMEGDKFTICYAPSLANRGRELSARDFHYNAGVVRFSEELFSCDFETDLCGLMPFIVDPRLSLSWQRHSGATETAGTGPSFDHTFGFSEGGEGESRGHYIYVDSPGYMVGETATLLAPPQIYPSGAYCLRFWYHMYGDDVNSLRVYVRDLTEGNGREIGDWGRPLLLRVGDQGDAWMEGGLEFVANGRTPQQLVFEALAGYSEKADIAIDDIRLSQGHCPPLLLRDDALQEYICGEVRLQTGTWGEDKQWFLEGAVSCAGRGYSLSMLQNRWVPCCVPRFGQYSVVLRDSFGDGWGGSRLTFRFFGEEVTFGEDFDGAEKKYTLNIGLLQIQKVEGTEDAIAIQVQVAASQQYVWCGAALAVAPPATAAILKKYGVRSQHATSRPGEVIRMEISNRGAPRRIVTPNTTYNVYCYAEAALASFAEEGRSALASQMTDAQVAASRVAVTTDNTAPQVHLLGTRPGLNEAEIIFTVNEAATLWCVAVEETASNAAGGEAPSIENVKRGSKVQILSDDANTERSLLIKNLDPDSFYHAYCYAQDAALPKGNGISPEVASRLTLSFRTLSKVPTLTIASYKAFQRGFRITVKTDAPAKVWCGAAMVGSAYPTKEDVRRVGASAVVEGTPLQTELEIRGVPPNTRYTIYCFASSRGGSEETSESEMWDNALEVTSFGKFCDVPVEPSDVTVGKPTPFDPITKDEELLVRGFMARQRQLAIEGIYRITLYVDKQRFIDFLDKGGPLPPRYARVRVGLCTNREGAYVQYKVGPLNAAATTAGAAATAAAASEMEIHQLGPAVPTDCGGYNPQGVFGRRLVADTEEQELSDVLEESFGAPFGGRHCQFSAKDKDAERKESEKEVESLSSSSSAEKQRRRSCLEFGPTFYEETEDLEEKDKESGKNLRRVWLGLRRPDGERIPFYFIATPLDVGDAKETLSPAQKAAAFSSGEEVFQLDRVEGVWYDGQEFSSLQAFLEAYRKGTLQKLTPELLAERKREKAEVLEKERQKQRRLAPAWLAPNPKGRGGLEHRAAPEHIEPQGRRYTLELSPSGSSYTVDYAGWHFTINFDRDTSLRLWDIRFGGQRFVFEMGLMEALAHYSVAERNWYFIDSWYGGLGAAARKLHPGIECAKTGQVLFNDGSVCIFEQDLARPLRAHWKGGVLRDGAPHMALVLRQMITVSNYDYVTDYIFHVSGFLEGTVSFTGELYAGVEVPWYSARQREHGTQVSGSMRMGALHGHLAVWKLDFDLTPDYSQNSVVFSEIVRDPQRPGAIKLKQWMGATEQDGYVSFNSTRPIHYTIVNEDHNVYGNLGGMTVIPYPTFAIPNPDFELYAGPCAWAKYRVATTVRHDFEGEATLPRDNKHALRPAVSLDRYISDKEPIRKADLVTWVSSAVWHIPVVEDMPLTLAQGNTLGWLIKPHNYYMEDMSMDLHNSLGGTTQDPGTCALIRQETPKYITTRAR